MALTHNGKLGITDAEMINSIYSSSFTIPRGFSLIPNPSKVFGSNETLVFRFQNLKNLSGQTVGTSSSLFSLVYEKNIISNHPDYPGYGYKKTHRIRGAAFRVCFLKIINNRVDSVRFFLGPTTNKKNLFAILSENNLVPTVDGVYIFLFSFNGWKKFDSGVSGPNFIPSDEEYRIFKAKIE